MAVWYTGGSCSQETWETLGNAATVQMDEPVALAPCHSPCEIPDTLKLSHHITTIISIHCRLGLFWILLSQSVYNTILLSLFRKWHKLCLFLYQACSLKKKKEREHNTAYILLLLLQNMLASLFFKPLYCIY